MPHAPSSEPEALAAFLEHQRGLGLLRLLACGSVDDGKSTLIGRLLYESEQVLDDQLATLERDSARQGTAGADIDFALLLDGLAAEREQGITIDVAWRTFTTARRRFIVADCPGHEQYTRNMATGASTAELAVVLVDARSGVLTQTRRHSFIAALMGIRHVVLAVNKIDLVDFDAARFAAIREDYLRAVAPLAFASVQAIPICARAGDNVTTRSPRTPWYDGPPLLDYLETVEVGAETQSGPFLMPVQWVNHPSADFRGYAGTVAGGRIARGDRLTIAPSGEAATLTRILGPAGEQAAAETGEAVTLLLDRPVDISRGDVLATAEAAPAATVRFEARLVWLDSAPAFPGRSYFFKLGTRTLAGTITRIRHRIDIATFTPEPAESLAANDVAEVAIALGAPMVMTPFAENHTLGGFVVIDRQSQATLAVGMVEHLAPAAPLTWQHTSLDRRTRAAALGQKPAVLWFTGLSGAGKSTIANLVEQRLHALGRHAYVLDGDNLRHGLNRDLGFSEADRVENIRRAAETARLLADAGLIVLACFISPYRSDRAAAREMMAEDEFVEVFVDTPVDECRRRDPKGLYRRADAGQIRNFTGVDAPYEAPETPEIRLETASTPPEVLADRLIAALRARGLLQA